MRTQSLSKGFACVVFALVCGLPMAAPGDLVVFEIEFGEAWSHAYGDTWATQTTYPGCPPEAVIPPDDTLWLCMISNVVGPFEDTGAWHFSYYSGSGGTYESGAYQIVDRTTLQDEFVDDPPYGTEWRYTEILTAVLTPTPGPGAGGVDWDGLELTAVFTHQFVHSPRPEGGYLSIEGTLTAVIIPEPATLFLMGLGLAWLSVWELKRLRG